MKTTILFLTWFILSIPAFGFGNKEPLPLKTLPPTPAVGKPPTLEDFHLVADFSGEKAVFVLTATVYVENSKGASLGILDGLVALTEIGSHPKWRVRADQNRFSLEFDRAGKFPIRLEFNTTVREHDGWKSVDFRVAPASIQPIVLKGLAVETKFDFVNAARPERQGDEFKSFLPSDGSVKLTWKTTRPETEGKLFYSGEMLSQVSVSPGMMRQVALLDFKIMQGEMTRLAINLHGAGEITRVQGDQVLSWNIEPATNSSNRRLIVQFNQPQKDKTAIQIQAQTPLGAFPQTADALLLQPEGATRFGGYYRIVNEGAVRLEVTRSAGLSQISPEQFPESDVSRSALNLTGNQRFAYRFSGVDCALQIQADQVLPELNVSQLISYRLGENEQAIDAEFELDIRDAPLRELLLRIPTNYVIARLNATGMSDYITGNAGTNEINQGQQEATLRLIYGQPVSGRQVIQLRLERNQALADASWSLPRVDIPKAKSIRGHIAVAADAGFRLTPEVTQALTEIATAFFPRKVAGIQSAFRLSEPAWKAVVRVERLPQAIQADGFHLFSIAEGIAYGSSVLNYVISGSPVSSFKVELSDEYFNVEFTGKDIRTWQKTEGGYLVQLHTPVAGPYTLLATYERPFKAQGETLAFTGARPLDAQSEQGHTLVISDYQFQVKTVDVSSGLLPLEPGEVPAEYRLFFDAPVLAAFRYTARPFNLKLALSPLAQGDSLSQVVDRASLVTHVSKEGQLLTEAHYFVKNRGHPGFRLSLPAGVEMWSASVNGSPVVPVLDNGTSLIPLPPHADPNAVLSIDLKLASRSKERNRVLVASPVLDAPVMLAEWKFLPDNNQRLAYDKGSLMPEGGVPDISGFATISSIFTGEDSGHARNLTLLIVAMVVFALVFWTWAGRQSKHSIFRLVLGSLFGFVALGFGVFAFIALNDIAGRNQRFLPRELSFLVPVQQSGSALSIELMNLPEKLSVLTFVISLWPVLVAGFIWLVSRNTKAPGLRLTGVVVAWTTLAWATLRAPHGEQAFLLVIAAFILLQCIAPAFRQLWHLARQQKLAPKISPGANPAAAATSWLLIGLLASAFCKTTKIWAAESVLPELVTHDIRVDDKFVSGTARIRWDAEKGQILPLLFETAVLTRIQYPSNTLALVRSPGLADKRIQQLVARKNGIFDIELRYEMQVSHRDAESGLVIPLLHGTINRANITVLNSDVDISSPQAVSVHRENSGSNSVASIVLSPASEVWLGWKPRTRDIQHEKPVFYGEISQLYVPAAGVIEGIHQVLIRPAKGELSELNLNIPPGLTISDVNGNGQVLLWRFDPDSRKLRITLNPAQSRPFTLFVRSQAACGPLPLEQKLGLVSVEGASGQIGLLGIATGNEVQLDSIVPEHLSAINLEDFPVEMAAALQSHLPGLTVRRAFRYSDLSASASVNVSAVEPDVRVETQDTLSLGEDRTVLAASSKVSITRAGIFRLSFLLPVGFDVESISGNSLSHWTEMKTDAGRIITMHLVGKTDGEQQFAISLAGPGIKAAKGWAVPQLVLREAGKQRGTLLIVPEQGMRLQAATREGVVQLDPQKSGIRQKGVLAFRILQNKWQLGLDLEQVEPWIQVTSLQHASINEAQTKVLANLQYQIENTGLKSLRIFIPTNAEGVRFQGDQVADFLPVAGVLTNGLQQWEIKLHRRIIGSFALQVFYQIPIAENASQTILRGVQVADVNLQRGFVTLQSGGRLQVGVDSLPEALQPIEWQSIPRALQQDLPANAANSAYRLVEPSFQLQLKLARHEVAKLLAARVNNVTLDSVISDDGIMLTKVRLELQPGDKRLLDLTLPRAAKFWFAFVNQSGVWPWRQQEHLLVPLEQQAPDGKPTPVEIFYSCKAGNVTASRLDLEMLAPKFDLPLENITWRVRLNDRWQVKHWAGAMQLESENVVAPPVAIDWQTYRQNEIALQSARTREAEEFLAAGNSALEKGDPRQARRSFQAAFGLSGHDAAFNEDARVQLHNIKLQQALIGLNVRQAAGSSDNASLNGKFRDVLNRKEAAYSQQEAKEIIDRNSADENAVFMRLAERLIQQQDAAVSSPAAIRANIPDQGRVLSFKRSVLVDTWADLSIVLEAKAKASSPNGYCLGILAATLLVLGGLGFAGRSFRQYQAQA